MEDIRVIIKIGAMGILLLGVEETLKASGKQNIAMYVGIGGGVIILGTIVKIVYDAFQQITTMFML